MAGYKDDKFNFSNEEIKILNFWKNENIFEKIQETRKSEYERHECDTRMFSFYDGPPFATGLPHYGHILAGTIKDVITRFATQNNCYVERRFGWDCHGLPVEYEIDKRFGIRSMNDIQAMGGICAYNNECRQIVMRYAMQWEDLVQRMGRWIEFRNDYKTMYVWYMESVWWVFSQLYAKGLIYKGTKVMPYSLGCQTPLSNFEAGQNYRTVDETAVTVAFNVLNGERFSGDKLLVWTTTPWSLTANLALCVNPNTVYVRVRDKTTGDVYIIAKECIENIFLDYKKSNKYHIINDFEGCHLRNIKYTPPFNYFKEYGHKFNAFRILVDEYVKTNIGTGIVHQAPFFGEDDYRVCLLHGIVTKTSPIVCPLDNNGCFTAEISDFNGYFYKEANTPIIKNLTQLNAIIKVEKIKHSVPFCWRSDSELIYKSVSCWFMRIEEMTDEFLQNNSQTKWTPESVKEKRFTNWLSNARDWAISRNRYWGTPIPIWTSETGDEIVCIGSLAELKQKTGIRDITDLHRESIDQLVIPSAVPGRPPLHRISEIFDCWFESGAMPYAQAHYPFENKEKFNATFPADFIAEGIDQTRGWFYTLLVLSTALFGRAPYRHVIVNGLVLAADGQKMSKRKQNYPDPMDIICKYGADALRLYLIDSPLVHGGNLSFQEIGVKNMVKCILLPWYNGLKFLLQNIERYEFDTQSKFKFDEMEIIGNEIPIIDCIDLWILSRNEIILHSIKEHMLKYQLQPITPILIEYIDDLTNWYIRLKRPTLKGHHNDLECKRTLTVLFYILFNLSKLTAAFIPFFAEYVYQQLFKYTRKQDQSDINSVHFTGLPQPKMMFRNLEIEKIFTFFKRIIEAGRKLREQNVWPLKYPIAEIIVLHVDGKYLDRLKAFEEILLQELNCKCLTLSCDLTLYGVQRKMQPNYKILMKRFKGEFKEIAKEINQLNDMAIETALSTNEIRIMGHQIITSKELYVSYELVANDTRKANNFYTFSSDNEIMIAIDFTNITHEMQIEGLIREIINRIQRLKKSINLKPADKVVLYYKVIPPEVAPSDNEIIKLDKIIEENIEAIKNTIKSDILKYQTKDSDHFDNILTEQIISVKNYSLKLLICQVF